MDDNIVKTKLKKIFQDVFKDKKTDFEKNIFFKDYPKWDSLAHLNLIGSIELEFKISFDLDEISEMNSFNSLKDSILSKKIKSR